MYCALSGTFANFLRLFEGAKLGRHVYKLFDDGVSWQEYVNGSNTWRINVEGWNKQF
jgi:hypothetical protein